jgi:hypothetical protein
MPTTSQTNPLVFHKFNDLPKEIQFMIWENALPGPRLVHIYQKPLKSTIKDWERANGATRRSDWFLAAGMIDAWEVDWIDEGVMESYYGDDLEGSTPPTDDDAMKDKRLVGFKSISELLHMALACKDAFDVVSKNYPLAFNCFGSFAQTFFNFELDTLYIRNENIQCFNDGLETMFYTGICGHDVIGSKDDMQKVERLALELEVDADGELYLLYFSGLSEWIVYIMHYFPSLKTLTFVVGHYESDTIGASKDESIISLIDPIDVDEAIDSYNNYDSEPGDFGMLPDELVHPYNVDAYDLDFEVVEVEGLFEHWGMDVSMVPKIEFKVAITKERKDELDWSRKTCGEIIDRDNEELDKWYEAGCPGGDEEVDV